MMAPLRAGQIKAARALLGWSQEELAQASGLAVNTIRNIEMGAISPRLTTNSLIRQVIEEAGLEFTDGEGVKRRSDDVRLYQGADAGEAFFASLGAAMRGKGGDVAILVPSLDLLRQVCDVGSSDVWTPLEQLASVASVQCLVGDAASSTPLPSAVQCRRIAPHLIGPVPCFIYGTLYALALLDRTAAPRFVTFRTASTAQAYRHHFLQLWNTAAPLLAPVVPSRETRRRD